MVKSIEQQDAVEYEYMKKTVLGAKLALVQAGYGCFGWQEDGRYPLPKNSDSVTVYLKRNRKLMNKTELTRLQQNFEACLEEICALERSGSRMASIVAVLVGLVGLALTVGAVVAALMSPPDLWMCLVLAVPGCVGLIAPIFFYYKIKKRRARAVAPLIEKKQEEMYAVMERGRSLL